MELKSKEKDTSDSIYKIKDQANWLELGMIPIIHSKHLSFPACSWLLFNLNILQILVRQYITNSYLQEVWHYDLGIKREVPTNLNKEIDEAGFKNNSEINKEE